MPTTNKLVAPKYIISWKVLPLMQQYVITREVYIEIYLSKHNIVEPWKKLLRWNINVNIDVNDNFISVLVGHE